MGFELNVITDLPEVKKIVERRGLAPGGRVQKVFTQNVYNLSALYTPFQNGILSERNVDIGDDYILYSSPYARYQWYGVVMEGKPKKTPTNIPLRYNQAPMRGKEWTLRMWSDRGDEIVEMAAKAAGGRKG